MLKHRCPQCDNIFYCGNTHPICSPPIKSENMCLCFGCFVRELKRSVYFKSYTSDVLSDIFKHCYSNIPLLKKIIILL